MFTPALVKNLSNSLAMLLAELIGLPLTLIHSGVFCLKLVSMAFPIASIFWRVLSLLPICFKMLFLAKAN
jgi:hypothetical protein